MRLLMHHLPYMPVYRRKLFKVGLCGIIALECDREEKEWTIVRFNQTA